MSDPETFPTDRPQRLFNRPIECGFRMLFVLSAYKTSADLQRLISYDYLLVHSGDVENGPPSLHPAVPFRGSEWLVKRDLVSEGLNLMFTRELIDKTVTPDGFFYRGTDMTAAFIALLKSPYAIDLKARAQWVANEFGGMSNAELDSFMTANVGRWGAEFDRLTALRDLVL
jgi:hypothetical protein